MLELEPFLLRAIAASLALALVAAPLGSLVIWNRMAYFGETVSQASLIGIALGLFLGVDITGPVIFVTLVVAGLLILLSRQKIVPLDAILGLMHHGALALGVIATLSLRGPAVDLMSYLFGDIFAVTTTDLYWVYGGGALVLAILAWLWQPMLRLAVHEELAAAEGVNRDLVKAVFIVLLSLTIAIAIKIVGALLVIAFLIVPAVAARPFSSTPERMALLAALVAAASVVLGITLSLNFDVPGGPSIVLFMAVIAGFSVASAALRRNA
ncbi:MULTISPECIES: metal ABC transporter permease [Hyphomicrobium]|jgi:zinc transport system permease protein|uniref:metal ABC transporter permease n=1 Tax=Hyphomicrobium TaxID=81 RepID=UPI00036FE31D|nr:MULTISPECIES: metal ABC transporter permease [Hyphomicrobium]WBT38860.1 metal ABC transporter permease [Hyphomicrobium sp. DMF-1]HML44666.1 metal ABC transporter permease [Hyphomicrobium zavarzinii]